MTNRQPDEVLNQTDCMNIFYNLLKATPKDGSTIYGAVLDCELNSDGEINPITILDDERRGPILVRKGFSVADSVPFTTTDANVFLNGVASDLAAVNPVPERLRLRGDLLQCEVQDHLGLYHQRLGR